MNSAQLSYELRNDSGRWLRNRRAIVGLSFTAAECMQVVGLYQIGLLPHVPELPLPGFDADKVDASDEAYEKLSMPDAFPRPGKLCRDRVETRPWIPVLMGGKVMLDALQAGKLTWD